MPARATQEKVLQTATVINLILPVPDTDFRDFLDEVEELGGFAPEIIEAIEKDLDGQARKKKRLRVEDRKFFESQTEDLPELDIGESASLAEELKLAVGRPRIERDLRPLRSLGPNDRPAASITRRHNPTSLLSLSR